MDSPGPRTAGGIIGENDLSEKIIGINRELNSYELCDGTKVAIDHYVILSSLQNL